MPHPAYSVQLVLLVLALFGLARHLARQGSSMTEPRFVAMSVLAGILGVLIIGAAFRTMAVASVLGLPAGSIDDHRIGWIKAALALGAAGLSAYEAKLVAAKKAPARRWTKGVALALAAMSIGAYFRFGDPGATRFYHGHEFFHYYLGSKYGRELGYEGIYKCVALAQADSGQANEVRARKMMDLGTDLLVPAKTALDHAEDCRGRFTPARFASFTSDVMQFRRSSSLAYWNHMQTDHGYNPPPVWTMMGHFWSSLHAPTEGYLQFLASFDVILIGAMFAAIAWAFGWRVFAVAAIFWGCQGAADYYFTGGAFLRQDWLFLLVLSACFAKKRCYALTGAAFAYATLLRVFPGLLIVGWAVVAGAHLWRHKRMATSHARVLLGGVAATAILVSTSAVVAGKDAYPEFYRHILVHKHTPLTNNMGLETILSQSYAGRQEFAANDKLVDPFERWESMRRERLSAFRPLHLVLLVTIGIAFVAVVRRVRSLWVAQALSLVFVVSLVELTSYYYSFFILGALLSRQRPSLEQGVLAVAGISQLLAVNWYVSTFFDDKFVAQSILFCVFALTLIGAHWPSRRRLGRLAA